MDRAHGYVNVSAAARPICQLRAAFCSVGHVGLRNNPLLAILGQAGHRPDCGRPPGGLGRGRLLLRSLLRGLERKIHLGHRNKQKQQVVRTRVSVRQTLARGRWDRPWLACRGNGEPYRASVRHGWELCNWCSTAGLGCGAADDSACGPAAESARCIARCRRPGRGNATGGAAPRSAGASSRCACTS